MNELIIQMAPAENMSFLEGIYRWGIEVIKVIQKIENPALTSLIKFITALGTEALYLPLILFIFWWVDEKQGLRFGILIIVTAWINAFMKVILKQPRPFNLDASVGLAAESSYGAPSGHAQMSLTFWIPMAAWLSQLWAAKVPANLPDAEKKRRGRKILLWTCTVLFILLMGFTRLYLGVHFPTDLLAGWVLGGVILVIWFIPGPRLEKLLTPIGLRFQNIIAAVIAFIMSGLYPRDRMLAALFLGFCLGYTLMKKRFPFTARGQIKGKKPGPMIAVFRCVTGFLGIAVIYLGLRLFFPGEGSFFSSLPLWGHASPFYEIGRFLRYGLIGFWASAGAPWFFIRMGLAAPASEDVKGNSGGGQAGKP